MKYQYIVIYPPGNTFYDGKTVDNYTLARMLIENLQSGKDAAAPEGWKIQRWEVDPKTSQPKPDYDSFRWYYE